MTSPFAAETLAELIFSRSKSREPWLIAPHDPLVDAQALRISFEEIVLPSGRIAGALRSLGAERGRVVGIIAESSREFVQLLFGAILAGLVPAPLHLPSFAARLEDYVERVQSILRESDAQFLLLADAFQRIGRSFDGSSGVVRCTAELTELGGQQSAWTPEDASTPPDDSAIIQFSSGSTRRPAGVELSHRNVLANAAAIGRTVRTTQADVVLCWLPLYHDMGLTGSLLYSWYWGIPLVLLSPGTFITQPASWLWAVSRFGVTQCAAPNFAYALCSKRSKVPDEALSGLDLRKWSVACNGSEAIQQSTVGAFTERFGPYGFRPEAMYLTYGLAEATVACSFTSGAGGPQFDLVDRRSLETGVARPAEVGSAARAVASVGNAIEGSRIRVVDDQGAIVAERRMGHIEFTGPSVMKGYYRRPAETSLAFTADGWLKTGDIGYLANGELHVVGRAKDIIKKAGAKFDAADIQSRVSDVTGVRTGCVAAFSVEDAVLGTEELVIVAETRVASEPELGRLAAAVTTAVAATFGTSVERVRLVAPGEIPKTSSGKVRVQECRRLYSSGSLRTVWPVSNKDSEP